MRRIGRNVGFIRSVLVALAIIVLSALGSTGAGAVAGSRGSVSPSGSLLGNPLIVPAAEPFVSGQQAAAALARRANPFAAFARERSRTQYANLNDAAAGRLLSKAFPAVVDQPAGGRPSLPAGTRALSYLTTHAMAIALPGNRLGILESSENIAKRGRNGRYQSTNLKLVHNGGGYTPVFSDVPVRIPGHLSSGVYLPGTGVTITPVDAHGRPL
ncbi:MAG TPA: hypothetical protein VGI26_08035, partial [Solirubrobacteraceae bacterium]